MTTLNASKIVRTFVYFLLGGIALFALYIYIALNWSYSTGERAGFLQKVSNKGWICKTWEGELIGRHARRSTRKISFHGS